MNTILANRSLTMASIQLAQDAVLYQNRTKVITLIDIPRSISLAQDTQSHPYTFQIQSSPAPQTPFPSIEPKTEAAKARVVGMQADEDSAIRFPVALLQKALQEITQSYHGVWCLERNLAGLQKNGKIGKRKFQNDNAEGDNSDLPQYTDKFTRLSGKLLSQSLGSFHDPMDLSSLTAPASNVCSVVRPLHTRLLYNTCSHSLFLKHVGPDPQSSNHYLIPPNSGFFLSDIDYDTVPAMSMAALTRYPNPSPTADRGQFDLIVLDPPWENRSARRAARYTTMRHSDPMEALQSTLGQHIALNGIVACWITNTARVRQTALKCFEAWDVTLIEEWAWLKVTTKGEPVTALDGLWRKPYEILLVGRKQVDDMEKADGDLVRRVVVGVPDLHSRKPNLKALIEPLLPTEYRALEIFARNLTAGWWAWGNDVLKYAVVAHEKSDCP